MRAAALLLVLVLLAGCTALELRAGSGELSTAALSGGSVLDVPGYFSALSSSASRVENDGAAVVVLSGVIQDNNSESDVAWIKAYLDGSILVAANHTVTAAERLAATEPAAFGADGFKVWTGASAVDGALLFRWRVAIASGTPAGTYALRAAEGNPGAPASSARILLNVAKAASVAVSAAPVAWTGAAQPGSWGAWDAAPGATSVASANWLKLTNVGPLARPIVVVDFNELAFVGASDAAYTVPIGGNVAFAWWEDTTPGETSPSQGTYSYVTSADGAVSAQFSAVGNVIYVGYRVLALPGVLANQSYEATFTVTDAGGDDVGAARPDLIVTSIVPSNPKPAPGSTVYYNVTVRNVGAIATSAGSVAVALVSDNVTTQTTMLLPGPLAPDQSVSLVSAGINLPGQDTHPLVARVDPGNAIAESVESNNELVLYVGVGVTSGGTRD